MPDVKPDSLLEDKPQTLPQLAGETAENRTDAPDVTTTEDDCSLTLLERLDRRQNHVMHELDALDQQIQQLVQQCQSTNR